MNKYSINYGFGRAEFYTEETDPEAVIREFYRCANRCFGIRKSITRDPEILETFTGVGLPAIAHNVSDVTHVLSHSGGDVIVFDAAVEIHESVPEHEHLDLKPWKLKSEWGDWCSCKQCGSSSSRREHNKALIKAKERLNYDNHDHPREAPPRADLPPDRSG